MSVQSKRKIELQTWSAGAMLIVGSGLAIAGFCVDPVGEVSDSVIYIFAQCLIYAGSALGITAYINARFSALRNRIEGGKRDEAKS